jgi:hypothetical protein
MGVGFSMFGLQSDDDGPDNNLEIPAPVICLRAPSEAIERFLGLQQVFLSGSGYKYSSLV